MSVNHILKLYDNYIHQHFVCSVFGDTNKEGTPTSMRYKKCKKTSSDTSKTTKSLPVLRRGALVYGPT